MVRSIMDILENESIRFIDGRWSGGFVDMKALQVVIDSGRAEVYEKEGGWKFVRKVHQLTGGGGAEGHSEVKGGLS